MLDIFRLSEIDAYCSPSRIKPQNKQTTAARSSSQEADRRDARTASPTRPWSPGAAVTTASIASYFAVAADTT